MTPVLHVMIVSMISVDANLPSQRQTLLNVKQHFLSNRTQQEILNSTLSTLLFLSCVTKISKNRVTFEKILSRIIRALHGTYERI